MTPPSTPPDTTSPDDLPAIADVVVVGAGAAGLFAALAARGALAESGEVVAPPGDAPRVVLLDGQDPPGRKILISGGGRCNVTNARVTEHDFTTSSPTLLRNMLRAFGVEQTRTAFGDLEVALRSEPLGKLFPTTNRARDVLDALVGACDRAGIVTRFGVPVANVAARDDGCWEIDGLVAKRVVVATGGRSVPATGSTGFGLDLATRVGHELVPPVPALAPLLGRGGEALAGITVPVVLRVVDEAGRERRRAAGSMLFTHKGVTGPAALDVSEAVERARDAGETVRVLADLWSLADPEGVFAEHLGEAKLPGCCLADPPPTAQPGEVDRELQERAATTPRDTLGAVLADRLPRRLLHHLAACAGVPEATDTAIGQLPRHARRAVAARLAALDLEVESTAGYAKAEVTAGGVPLGELDRHTLESRRAPGLHLCGEACDVTGRLGGFNFQWAWSSGALAGRGAGRQA